MIEDKCLTIVSSYSKKEFIVERLINDDTVGFEEELIDFYEMNLVDIIEIEDFSGKVIFRGHNPELAGDIKSDQWVIQEGLEGKSNVSFEYGQSGFAIRAVAPINHEGEIIGLFMTGELFSEEFVEKLKTLTLLDNGIYREDKKIVATFDGLDILANDSISMLKKGESVFLKNEKINSKLYTIILEPIFLRDQYWGAVCLGISNTDSQRLYNYSNKQITYIVLIGFFIALLIYFFLARNINNSLVKIITGISNYSFDHSNEEIHLDRRDEFGIIADNFNTLIQRVDLYNERINRLQKDLLKSTRLATAGQVAASLAHEIRNPLSSIKMMTQIIKSRNLTDPSSTEEIDIILEEIDRINSKVKELLELARPSRMHFIKQDIRTVIESVLRLCGAIIEGNEIEVTTDFDQNLPDIKIDSEKLRIAFMNIIVNVVQAMTDGGNLILKCKYEKQELYIQICNTGDIKELPLDEDLFKPFFTTKKEGTGLGLAISKLIIERHKGTINISKEGRLICFNIVLPAKLDKEEAVFYGWDSDN
ncbi:MAG: GHKL domain-containing protein [Spirochaetales bacterium]|nr:GHKL domain-containing protein [Spirochaetales bacterium]